MSRLHLPLHEDWIALEIDRDKAYMSTDRLEYPELRTQSYTTRTHRTPCWTPRDVWHHTLSVPAMPPWLNLR